MKLQTGSSLIEVMVSLLVLAIGILGILAMQAKSMQYNQSANTFSKAVFLANDLAERARANPGNSLTPISYAGIDTTDSITSVDCSEGCSVTEIKQRDAALWAERVRQSLPSGRGETELYTDPASGRAYLKILLQFDDSRSEQSNAEGATLRDYKIMIPVPNEVPV